VDVEFRDGSFVVSGTDRSVSLMDLAVKHRGNMPRVRRACGRP
jgi:hypothetical protein